EITRRCLEVLWKYKHPVGFITKNALILRDLDILKEMAKLNLVRVSISITSLKEETRRLLEPRTASIKKRLETVKKLSENDIPVHVMMAPIIPLDIPVILTPHSGDTDPSRFLGQKDKNVTNLQFFS